MAHAVVEQTPGHNHHGRRRDADHRRESGDHYGRMTILIDGRTCAPAGFRCSTRVQVSLVQENIGRTVLPCTSLVDLADYPPNPGRLEQKTPARYAFWFTSETCTSRHHLEASKRTPTTQLINYSLSVSSTTGKKASPPQFIHGRNLHNGVLFAGFERESLYSYPDKTDLTNQ